MTDTDTTFDPSTAFGRLWILWHATADPQLAMSDDEVADVETVLKEHAAMAAELEGLRAERGSGLAWDEWCVRILISGGAVATDYNETEARIRYQELVDRPEKAQRIVRDATSYPGPIRRIELLCRTHWDGDYRVVKSAPQQPIPSEGDCGGHR